MPEALAETENWVAIAFILFLGLLAYLGAHRKIIGALDDRQSRIKAELDEAVRLREEAKALLAEFERKGREAEGEAEAIIANAKAETKITQAEAQALADVRSAASEAAVAVAAKILAVSATGKIAEDLLAKGIADVK